MAPPRLPYSPAAEQQTDDLIRYYDALDRIEAVRNLLRLLEQAEARIISAPEAGSPAPRPCPQLARPGRRWVKSGPYWINYAIRPLAILAVFHEKADIPGRL